MLTFHRSWCNVLVKLRHYDIYSHLCFGSAVFRHCSNMHEMKEIQDLYLVFIHKHSAGIWGLMCSALLESSEKLRAKERTPRLRIKRKDGGQGLSPKLAITKVFWKCVLALEHGLMLLSVFCLVCFMDHWPDITKGSQATVLYLSSTRWLTVCNCRVLRLPFWEVTRKHCHHCLTWGI